MPPGHRFAVSVARPPGAGIGETTALAPPGGGPVDGVRAREIELGARTPERAVRKG
ncbi:hypothetical protein GCM10023085_15200 [Actinomadura viridis]